ncbi:hypothetical protein HELRODRAFT_167969 [Helobdella robusta]|uniref:Uncharacterized protein n=1 Tax=Helobdella robusta TaxID=6412 RepID=T1F007_HELRO|nr:hypothetical protein HELRODRAFT_167969 [Helobdella robusta]ESO10110.1 hypothetical protein HELRODRAFT_167969 [Helobdella robusta]
MSSCSSCSDSKVTYTVTQLLNKLIKNLCLYDFPCGYGNWVIHCNEKSVDFHNKETAGCYEKVDDLYDFVKFPRSPWCTYCEWSEDAYYLKQLAVLRPALINENFIKCYFKTLILRDKKIFEIDPDFVRFKNLKKLILSANIISKLDPKCFNRKIQHLECYGNEISNIEDFSKHPPALFYLGLGHNKISTIKDCFNAQSWPCLTSLDLCLNDLTNLPDLCNQLSSLSDPDFKRSEINLFISHINGLPPSTNYFESTDEILQRQFRVEYKFLKGVSRKQTTEQQNDFFKDYQFNAKTESDEITIDTYKTKLHDWAEIVQLRELRKFFYHDLRELKKFLCGHLEIYIMEKKTLLKAKELQIESISIKTDYELVQGFVVPLTSLLMGQRQLNLLITKNMRVKTKPAVQAGELKSSEEAKKSRQNKKKKSRTELKDDSNTDVLSPTKDEFVDQTLELELSIQIADNY